ncbi:MAG TPA: putative cytokinetic ring protein SteA [Microthrixaceae bacterium]|mgnify:CR=1 FL=1|nr:putative cytokinetic ring protein SteA [Microthrixaceae bacterium]
MAGIFRRRGVDVADVETPVVGPVLKDRRTKELVGRLQPGDIAVIDHIDIDSVAAESLVAAQPAAVLNVAASSSGRYPNEGPLILLRAGIPLVDALGPEVMEQLSDSDVVTIVDDVVRLGDTTVATGTRQDEASILEIHQRSRETLGEELNRFVENTVEYLEHNTDLLDDALEMPELDQDWTGRQVLIVVRGVGYKEDLALLRRTAYLREMRPIVVAVDGGADALLDEGVRPDVIIGDMDSVSESALRCGAELIVHAYRDGRAPGADRLIPMGLEHHLFLASGTSEDIAMLLAYEKGAELIVAVGTHTSMVDFLDKGRAGMASTMVTRIKVGPILVDAKGVSRLYQGRVRKRDLLLLVLAAMFAMGVVILISEPIRLLIRANWVLLTGIVPGGLTP